MAVRTLWRNNVVITWTYWYCINVFFPAAGFISVTLKAALNYALIPAASLPRILWGILRGSVDAVSDTFRFLPFIFPPTQSPCSVAGECCWNLQCSQIQKGRRKSSEGRSLQHHLSQITKTQMKEKLHFLCLCMQHRTGNVRDPSHCIAHVCRIGVGVFKYTDSL